MTTEPVYVRCELTQLIQNPLIKVTNKPALKGTYNKSLNKGQSRSPFNE